MTDPKTVMYEEGRRQALDLIARAPELDGTAVIAEEDHIPSWNEKTDYSGQPKGIPVTDEGQVWTLIIPHNAASYPGVRPSGNRACWGLAHTKDPKKAKPWVASYGVSGRYMLDECCTYPYTDGTTHVFRNRYDNNEFPPLTLNVDDRWEDLGEVGTV